MSQVAGQQSKGRQAGGLDQEAVGSSLSDQPLRRKSRVGTESGSALRPRDRGREQGSRALLSIGSPPSVGASSEARSFGFSALGLESSGRLPFQVEDLGPEPGRRGDLTEGRSSSLLSFGSSGAGSSSCSRGNSRSTLHFSALFWVVSLGEGQEVLSQEGVFSQAREAELGPGDERQRFLWVVSLGVSLRPSKGGRDKHLR
jgi:hypothetical protein